MLCRLFFPPVPAYTFHGMVLSQDTYLRFGPYLDLLTGIRTALTINEGIIKVVGPDESGKTALCRNLAHELKAEGHDVIFFESPPESVEFLHTRIQTELDLPRDKNFTRSLSRYLLAKAPPNNRLIIIYDDAEKISKDIFILIRLLNNVHDSSDTLVSQVICGTPKLDRVFDDPVLRSLTQYLNQSFTLRPMNQDELLDFYYGFKKQAGVTGKDLNTKELNQLFATGKGLPGRTINLLEQRFSAPVQESLSAAEPAVTPTHDPDIDAMPAVETPVSPDVREVEEILDEEDIPITAPIYFKAALSLVVIITTAILAFVLSGDNIPENAQVAEILADDTPLYLDEVDPAAAAETAATDIQVPVLGGPIQEPAEATEDVVGTPVSEPGVLEPVDDSPILAGAANSVSSPDTEPVIVAAEARDATGEDGLVSVPVLVEAGAGAMLDTAAADDSIPEAITPPSPDDTQDVAADAIPPETLAAPALPEVLNTVIQSWVDDWQSGNSSGYLSAYHEAFMPSYHDSREAWRSERESRIEGVTGIAVSFDRFEMMANDADTALVRFWLNYSRGSYTDETHKEIEFRRVDTDWLILGERNLEVIVR